MTSLRTDRASLEVATDPEAVFTALADPALLAQWLPPHGMTARVLEYDFRVGGRYLIELTYREGAGAGKTSENTDRTQGRFLAIEPDRRVVQSVAFDADDPALAGEMRMTWALQPTPRGTLVTITAEDVPAGIAKADHDAGLRATLANLARLLA